MQINTKLLIESLLVLTDNSVAAVNNFKEIDSRVLQFKRTADSWSILECIEHLNLYGDFYLPEMERQIIAHMGSDPAPIFKSGLIGNYFANLMLVKDGSVTKIKSPKDKNPANATLTITTLDRFLKQQELLTSLLRHAGNIDLVKTRTAISLTPLVKLRLGDTFRFYVYHIDRHMRQAENILRETSQFKTRQAVT